ncbi:ubiquitin--protein ligase [Onchocerca flexuosa]|uniref:Ubiquitin--protein ligase n=1 Tax=Onchocerca flexuosa TaxID=387005 RepID=A0A238BKZ9_9BILA|nr:ubiquitin--protein ligase [Onchocerca flexuosa]
MSQNIAFSRVQRECKEIITNKELAETGVMIEIRNDSLTKIRGEIRGPPDSPYEGGTYALDITIPDEYPFQPPIIRRAKSFGIVENLSDLAASLTLRTVLLSIQALLTLPEPNDPQDAVVARQYMDNLQLYKRTARFWAQHYAKAEGKRDDEFWNKIDKLKDMGVKQEEAISALSCNWWDLSRATDYMSDKKECSISSKDNDVKKPKPCCACPETKKI